MPRKKDDSILIWEMREACENIQKIVENIRWHEFEKDMVVRYAIERLIEILGEAARHISKDFKDRPMEGNYWATSCYRTRIRGSTI